MSTPAEEAKKDAVEAKREAEQVAADEKKAAEAIKMHKTDVKLISLVDALVERHRDLRNQADGLTEKGQKALGQAELAIRDLQAYLTGHDDPLTSTK